ncbi:TPA: hypothetical protein ACHXNE_004485, partial [Shigella sonnei]
YSDLTEAEKTNVTNANSNAGRVASKLKKYSVCKMASESIAVWHHNRSRFGILPIIDWNSPVTPGINSFHHSLHCRV